MPDTATDTTEIDFRAPTPATVPAVDATIFQVIARAASDPAVNIDKMERLIAMQVRMEERRAQVEFDNAMAEAQAEMQPVRTDAKNPQTSSKYASHGALDEAIRPIYTGHGFSLSYNTGEASRPDDLRVLCRVAHRNGHREEYKIDMPADGKGAKGGDVMTRTHAAGSATTYGKRYLLGLIFNIAVVKDDDGNAAGARGTAGGGSQFRPERRQGSSWIDEARRDGTLDETRAKGTMPGKPQPAAAPADRTKYQIAVDKRIEHLKSRPHWSRENLDEIWKYNEQWILWMSDPDNKQLHEYQRFLDAFSEAEMNIQQPERVQ